MHELCHRCQRELPQGTAGSRQSGDDAILFCPHCSAPQIRLPEHMRSEGDSAPATTGATPPPRPILTDPRQIDWRAALFAAGLVAAVSAILAVLGINSGAASMADLFWMLSGAVIALGIYMRTRPRAWIDARVGGRIGLVTGILSISAVLVALAVAGVIARFGLHRMGGFDSELGQQFAALQVQMHERSQPADVQAKLIALMSSQEMRSGIAIFYLGILAILLLLLSTGGGAFAGMMRSMRTSGSQREP